MEYSILSLIFSASPMIMGIMALLLFMSVYSWAIIISKIISLRFAKKQAAEGLILFNDAPSLRDAVQSLSYGLDSPIYGVAQQGVTEFNLSTKSGVPESILVDNVQRSLEKGISTELTRINSSLSVLATCANTAPFIGLFGTVWGIMSSFHSIGLARSASLATVAPGISEALIATAIGLAVAIPASIAYNMFVGKISTIEDTLANFAGSFLNRVQREIHAPVADPRTAQQAQQAQQVQQARSQNSSIQMGRT